MHDFLRNHQGLHVTVRCRCSLSASLAYERKWHWKTFASVYASQNFAYYMCTEYVYFSEHSLAFICASEIRDQAKREHVPAGLAGGCAWVGDMWRSLCITVCVSVRVCITLWSAGDVWSAYVMLHTQLQICYCLFILYHSKILTFYYCPTTFNRLSTDAYKNNVF